MVTYQVKFETRADADAVMTAMEEMAMEDKIEHAFEVTLIEDSGDE